MSDYADALQDLMKCRLPPKGQGWRTVPEIAKDENRSKPTVRPMVNKFVEAGLWEMEMFCEITGGGAYIKTKHFRKKRKR